MTPLPGPALARTPVGNGQAAPQPNMPILPDIAGNLTELARWGSGQVWGLAYTTDSNSLWVRTAAGEFYYDTETWSLLSSQPKDSQLVAGVQRYRAEFIAGGGLRIIQIADGAEVGTLPQAHLPAIFTSDGERVVARLSGVDGDVGVWHLPTGQLLHALALGSLEADCYGGLSGLAMSPNDMYLATGCNEAGPLTIWRLADGQVVHYLSPDTYLTYGLAFSPDGALLAAFDAANAVRVWRVQDGALVHVLYGSRLLWWQNVGFLQFSPDGENLVAGLGNGQVLAWSMETGQLERELRGVAPTGEALSFSADGNRLAVGAWNSVQVWDLSSGRGLGEFASHRYHARLRPTVGFARRSGPSGLVINLSMSPDGRHVFATFEDDTGTVKIFRAGGDGLNSIEPIVAMQTWYMARFSPANLDFFIGARAGGLEVRRVSDWQLTREVELHEEEFVSEMAFDASGGQVAVLSSRGLRIFDVGNGQVLQTVDGIPPGSRLALFGGSSRLGVVRDSKLWVVNLDNGETQFLVTEPSNEEGRPTTLLSMAVAPHGTLVATGDDHGVIRVRHASDGALLRVIEAHQAGIVSLAFSVDGRYLASGSSDGTVRLWGIWP